MGSLEYPIVLLFCFILYLAAPLTGSHFIVILFLVTVPLMFSGEPVSELLQ